MDPAGVTDSAALAIRPDRLDRPRRFGGWRSSSGLACYTCWLRSRRALPMTLTEDSAIAAAAIIGESSSPKAG